MKLLLPTAVVFTCDAVLYITLFTRLPAIAGRIGLDKAELGLSMLGLGIGTFAALPLAGVICDRLGPPRCCRAALTGIALILPLVSMGPRAGMVACFFCYGFLRTNLEVAKNVLAIEIERQSGRMILARSHAFWPIGLGAGSCLSSALVWLGLGPAAHQAVVGLAVLGGVGWLSRLDLPEAEARPPGKQPLFVRPDRHVLALCAMTIGFAVCEGTIYDWGALFLTENVGISQAMVGVVFACFTASMLAMRTVGDSVREWVPPDKLLQLMACVTLLALAVLLTAQGSASAGLGLLIAGAGVALNAPVITAMAVRLPGGSPARNLAALSLAMQLGTLGVPPFFGLIGHSFGLDAVILLLVPLLCLSYCMARQSRQTVLRTS